MNSATTPLARESLIELESQQDRGLAISAEESEPTPSAIMAQVPVIGQDAAKKTIASALYWFKRTKFDSPSWDSFPSRRNVFLFGPRSCGMTSLIRESAGAAGLPCVQPDIAEYIAAGPSGGGKNVNDLAVSLLRELGGSTLSPGPLGVISLEGIEQLAIASRDTGTWKESFQAALARLADGKHLTLTFNGKLVNLDSRRILFIASSNPEGLENLVRKRLGEGGLGFTPIPAGAERWRNDDVLGRATVDDFIQFGFTRSFLSAFEIRAALHPLNHFHLQQICQLQQSPVTRFKDVFASLGIVLEISSQALSEIALAAAHLDIGARGISTILHQLLDETTIQVVNQCRSVQKVTIKDLNSSPGIVFGPPVIACQSLTKHRSTEDEIPEDVQELFPTGLPRRPARSRSSLSGVRWANKNDLAPWLSKECANTRI
jgi:ATP-dependent Clp protease ATP-binding subunit ClpX